MPIKSTAIHLQDHMLLDKDYGSIGIIVDIRLCIVVWVPLTPRLKENPLASKFREGYPEVTVFRFSNSNALALAMASSRL